MEVLSRLFRLPSHLRLDTWKLDDEPARLILTVAAERPIAECPLCLMPTSRVHSRYERTLADLTCGECAVAWKVGVRKFFCLNVDCKRRIFAERLGRVAAAWARKTGRLAERLAAIALALGGEAGSRLAGRIGLPTSGTTLLRSIHRLPLPEPSTPSVLGVDDFAFRRCHSYGTILVDLDCRRPLALLAGRDAATLADWLKAHPGVQVLSRDRSNAYRSGMNAGAPEAVQVADRFHLFENLAEALERAMETQNAALKAVEATHLLARAAKPVGAPLSQMPVVEREAQPSGSYRAKRQALHREIWELHKAGWSAAAIAHYLRVGVRTVQRDLCKPSYCVDHRREDTGTCVLNPHKAHLIGLWKSGIRAHVKLLESLKQQGCSVGERTLSRFLKRLVEEGALPARMGARRVERLSAEPRGRSLTPKRAAWLVLRLPGNREPDEEELLGRLREQNKELATAAELAEGFAWMLRARRPEQFDGWLERAASCSLEPLQRFAEGLRGDYDAVKAALRLPISNGPVEGHINRLKMLKRQMYGRAGLKLLSLRFLLAA